MLQDSLATGSDTCGLLGRCIMSVGRESLFSGVTESHQFQHSLRCAFDMEDVCAYLKELGIPLFGEPLLASRTGGAKSREIGALRRSSCTILGVGAWLGVCAISDLCIEADVCTGNEGA